MILFYLLPQPLPGHTDSTVIHNKIIPHLSPSNDYFFVNNKELTPLSPLLSPRKNVQKPQTIRIIPEDFFLFIPRQVA
jgi:hypothetical protein